MVQYFIESYECIISTNWILLHVAKMNISSNEYFKGIFIIPEQDRKTCVRDQYI